jgi:hypothetical protein
MTIRAYSQRCHHTRYLLLMGYVCGAMLTARVGWVAIVEAFNPDDLPDLLAIIAERLPALFPIHMVSGGLALVLVPLTIALRRWPRWHRICGWLAGACVIIGGVTALVVAVYSVSPRLARVGFFIQGLSWIVLLSAGFVMIRRRRTGDHRRLMLMMAAVTSAAVLLRLALLGFVSCLPRADYRLFYSLTAWLAWLLPLGAVAWATRSQRRMTE